MSPLNWQSKTKIDECTAWHYFVKSILFAGAVGKSNALLNLLRTISFQPEKILFLDD